MVKLKSYSAKMENSGMAIKSAVSLKKIFIIVEVQFANRFQEISLFSFNYLTKNTQDVALIDYSQLSLNVPV